MSAVQRQMCRALLRLAREHDKKPHLGCLLPNSMFAGLGGEEALVPPHAAMAEVVRDAYRSQSGHDPRRAAWVLHFNLHREALWSSERERAASEAPRAWAPQHPNMDWFKRQLAELKVQPLGLEDLAERGQPSELDILRSMQDAGCRPSSEVLLQALKQLACRHGGFQHTLEAFWHWELYGTADSHISEHREEVAHMLVKSALLDYHRCASSQSSAQCAWKRPLRVWRAFLLPGACLPGACITNQLLHRVASLALHSRSGDELRELVIELQAAAKDATSRGVQPTGSVYQAMGRAFNRAGEMQAAMECAIGLVAAGGSIPAGLSVDLLEWALEEGDKDAATFLEEEIAASGKTQYLAALNSPTC